MNSELVYQLNPHIKRLDRAYQVRIVNRIEAWFEKYRMGRVKSPTASGKTLMMIHTLLRRFGGQNIHLVVAPRLGLLTQHHIEFRKVMSDKTNYIAYDFHSGSVEHDWENQSRFQEKSGIQVSQVEDEWERARANGCDLVVFTTYMSFMRLKHTPMHTIVFDESQYCVAENVFENIPQMTLTENGKKLFLTATEKYTASNNGRGHNNTEVFGGLIYEQPPNELIDDGYILPPRLHVMYVSGDPDKYYLIDEVVNLTKVQIELATNIPETKILFSLKGTADVEYISTKLDLLHSKFPGYKIFAIISDASHGAQIDGVQVNRDEFFRQLNSCDKAIIFHYDILAEGIDISGITGVAIVRNMEHAKILQTIGRAQRVYRDEIDVPRKQRKKKFANISCTAFNGISESRDYLKQIVVAIRNGGFDISTEHVIFTDNVGFGIAEPGITDSFIDRNHGVKALAEFKGIMHDLETNDEIFKFSAYSTYDLIGMISYDRT